MNRQQIIDTFKKYDDNCGYIAQKDMRHPSPQIHALLLTYEIDGDKQVIDLVDDSGSKVYFGPAFRLDDEYDINEEKIRQLCCCGVEFDEDKSSMFMTV